MWGSEDRFTGNHWPGLVEHSTPRTAGGTFLRFPSAIRPSVRKRPRTVQCPDRRPPKGGFSPDTHDVCTHPHAQLRARALLSSPQNSTADGWMDGWMDLGLPGRQGLAGPSPRLRAPTRHPQAETEPVDGGNKSRAWLRLSMGGRRRRRAYRCDRMAPLAGGWRAS